MNLDADGPLEHYLDDLLGCLRGTPHDVRRALTECESHLRESVERLTLDGVPADDAAHRAIVSFGTARTVAAGLNAAMAPARRRLLVPALLHTAWRLTGVGLTAIGVSGVLAWITMKLTSPAAVFADPPSTHYGLSSCTYWLHLHPGAGTCARAALLEGRDDALFQRSALGVVGLLILAISRAWRRRSHANPRIDLRIPAALIAVTTFGLVGTFLTGYGIDRAVQDTGAGQWLVAGIVALAVAVAYARTLWRTPSLWAVAADAAPAG